MTSLNRISDFVQNLWGGPQACQAPEGAQTAQPAAPSAPAAAAPQDAARLEEQAQSPYPGAGAAQVEVGRYGRGPNGTLEDILTRQGYSAAEIYRRNRDGNRLLDDVARVNDLKDPNLLHPGQRLTVPVKPEEPAPAPAPPANDGAQPPANEGTQPPAQDGEQPPVPQPRPRPPAPRPRDMVGVQVDRWGQGPNSSIEGVLRNQGYTPQEMYRRDRNGRTLIDKVAEWNGLERPEDLRAGSTLQVPPKPGRPAPAPPQGGEAPAPQPAPAPPQGGEAPAPAPQPAPEPAPAPPQGGEAPAPQPAPEPQPQPQPDNNEGLTAEMGLILEGAREGKLTRDEFRALNSAANRYEEMRADYGKDGFTPTELATLGQHERSYGHMYARFYEHDRSTIEFAADEPQDPRVQQRIRMADEGGAIFDRFRAGEITMEQALEMLRRQRLSSRELGQAS